MVGGVGLGAERPGVAAAGLAASAVLAGALALALLVAERRRHEAAEETLAAEARFLETFLQALAAVSEPRDPQATLDRTCAEARQLFGAHAARVIPAEQAPVGDAHAIEDGARVPLRAGETAVGTLELRRPDPFDAVDLSRAAMLAEFAARAVEDARLLEDARAREEDRARLAERLITAEQDERRRLSIFLHDGPLQSMSGIALMHDAALAAIRDGRHEDAERVIASSLERERATIRALRDLSFEIEPIVLRDQGFAAAVRGLAQQLEDSHGITVSVDVGVGEQLGEKAQVALYQLIREALHQALRRKPSRIGVTLAEGDGAYTTEIRDDGIGERRRGGVEELSERVRLLNGHVSLENLPGRGTSVRVVLPAYAGATSRGEASGERSGEAG